MSSGVKNLASISDDISPPIYNNKLSSLDIMSINNELLCAISTNSESFGTKSLVSSDVSPEEVSLVSSKGFYCGDLE